MTMPSRMPKGTPHIRHANQRERGGIDMYLPQPLLERPYMALRSGDQIKKRLGDIGVLFIIPIKNRKGVAKATNRKRGRGRMGCGAAQLFSHLIPNQDKTKDAKATNLEKEGWGVRRFTRTESAG